MSIQYWNFYKNILNHTNKTFDEFYGVVVPSDINLIEASGSSHVQIWKKTESLIDISVSYLCLRPD